MNTLVVSTLSREGRILRSELWDTHEPKGLGYPIKYCLEKTSGGIRIRDLQTFFVKEISDETLSTSQIALNGGALRLQFHPTHGTSIRSLAPIATVTNAIQDAKAFKEICTRVFGALSTALLVLVVAQAILPKPKDELVPAQFAKIIMKPVQRSETASSEHHTKAVNLVQTFKTEKVQRSTQALLKASIVSLLAKTTPFSTSRSKSSLNALFAQTSRLNLGKEIGMNANPKSLSVGTLAGTGSKTGGYAAGEHAGVANQGNVFVSLDTHDSLVDEGLSKDEVGKVIHAHIAEVRYCYESAMIKNPDVQGKLIVNFIIHSVKNTLSIGTVKTARVNTSTVGDELLDQCILNRLTQWRFPKPRGGVEVAVAYPFIFKSLGK